MSFKNIIACLLMGTFFLACSKDGDEPDPGNNKTAHLAIRADIRSAGSGPRAAASGLRAAGGDANALTGETNINNITAFAFGEDGSLLGYNLITEDAGKKEVDMEVESGQHVKLLLIANAPASLIARPANMAELQARLIELTQQSQSNLTFSTEVITSEVALVNGESYYVGYVEADNLNNINTPLLLTRIAARIEINTVKTAFTDKLKGKTVRIDHLTLANARSKSHLYSEADWGAVEAAGNLVYGSGATDVATGFAPVSSPVDYLGKDFTGVTVGNATPINAPLLEMYTLENKTAATPTLLVIKATLVEDNITKYFTVPINEDGIKNNRADHDYVKRNYIYRLHVTFGDTSFTPEDPDTSLDLRVEVAEWGNVHQTEEI